MRRQNYIVILLIVLQCTLIGCGGSTSQLALRQSAEKVATVAQFKAALIKTKPFIFTTYNKFTRPKDPLVIYIEGDGHSFTRNGKAVSLDPTPHNPLALKLAVLDQHSNVAYLARPCQFTDHNLDAACHPEVWSSHRFTENVIASMNEAVEALKQKSAADKIHLVGFSGGATIAVLIAARRNDIASLKTVAGDLDHEKMSEYHKSLALTNALNPKHFAAKIAPIPQHHYIGDEDKIVPLFISQNFVQEVAKTHPQHANRTVLSKVTHHQGWEKLWPGLSARP